MLRNTFSRRNCGVKGKEKTSEEKFKAVFESSLDSLIVVDGKEGKILECNPATKRIFGYEKEALIGKDFSILFSPKVKATIKELIKKTKVYGAEFTQEFCKADGSILVMDLNATMIPWSKDRAILITLRDITERIQAERERDELILELKKAMKEIKTLSGLLPICASCKKIRDDKGYWHQVESYISSHSEAEFTHGICPECAKKLYPGFRKKKDSK